MPTSAVITKSATAIGFEVGGGSTKLDLKPTEVMPQASGQAKVEIKSNAGRTNVDVEVKGLRPEAREVLAKLSGIVLNYPSLRLAIEGYTDSTGSEQFNQAPSEKRADSVRDYLENQGLDSGMLTAQGLGISKAMIPACLQSLRRRR